MGSDGTLQPPTGGGGTTETESDQWGYSASGGYTRPLDGGTLSGDWSAGGGASDDYAAQTISTVNPDGSWTTTGTANSSGSGSGSSAYSGSGSFSQSSSAGDSASGSDSSFSSQASENYGQGWSSQYTVVSILAATGAVNTVTTASASGSASGNHTYSSSGSSSGWSQTGDYAAGNGTSSRSSASSGLSLAESLQSQWQENYVITAGPTGTTTTGGASGSSQASGDASWYNNASGFSESDSGGSGYSYASGNNWASGASGQDNYNDQSSWSEPYNLVGTSSSGATVDHVWGSETNTWSNGTWSSSQGSGSGSGSGSSTSFSTSGSGSSSYDQNVGYSGFYQDAGYSGMGAAADAGWSWGVGANGPLGPSAFSGVGDVFMPGDSVSVTNPGDQSNTEGDSVSLQVLASDWSAGGGGASGSGSGGGGGWSVSGLPAGLAVDTATGLITGTIQPGDAANGPYNVTATYTDAAGDSNSQSFLWTVESAVTMTDPGEQSVVEGGAVSLQVSAGDPSGGTATYGATGLPPGLNIDAQTGQITGTVTAGDAANGPYVSTVTATDGTYTGSETVAWDVAPAPVVDPSPTDQFFSALAGIGGSGAALLAMPAVAMAANPPGGEGPVGPIWLFDVPKLFMPEGENPLPFEPGALPEIGYGILTQIVENKILGWATTKLGVAGLIKTDYGLNGPSQFGKFSILDSNTLQQQLGLGEGLKEVEKKITEDLTAAKYTPSSIKFDLEATLRYTIVNEDDRGKPRPARVFWNVVLVLWTSAKKGSQVYVMRTMLGSTDSSYLDPNFESDPGRNYRAGVLPPVGW